MAFLSPALRVFAEQEIIMIPMGNETEVFLTNLTREAHGTEKLKLNLVRFVILIKRWKHFGDERSSINCVALLRENLLNQRKGEHAPSRPSGYPWRTFHISLKIFSSSFMS